MIKIGEEKKEYLYVYGIINHKNTQFKFKGLKNKPLQKINFQDIAVLTSSYPNLRPVLKEEEAMQHAEILKKIAQKTTIIPMSFGAVFKNQEILEVVLSKSYPVIKKTLELIKDKIELGVKVVKKPLEENKLEDQPDERVKEILEALNKLSEESKEGDKFSERLLLNYSFLVEKKKFSQFSNKIGKLENKHQNLKFIYTGPWPPYSFVNINIKGS